MDKTSFVQNGLNRWGSDVTSKSDKITDTKRKNNNTVENEKKRFPQTFDEFVKEHNNLFNESFNTTDDNFDFSKYADKDQSAIEAILKQLEASGIISYKKRPDGTIEITQNYQKKDPSELITNDEELATNKKFMEDMLKGSTSVYNKKGGTTIFEIKTKDGVMKFVISKKLNYSPSKDLSQLAKISAKGGTHSFISGIQAEMNRIKNDPSLDPNEIKRALAQMRGVIQSAKTKIRKLDEEELLDNIRSRAAKRRELEKSRKYAEELKKKRTKRRSIEYAQIHQKFAILGEMPYSSSREENENDYLDELFADTYIPEIPTMGVSVPAETLTPSEAVPPDVSVDAGIEAPVSADASIADISI